MPRPQERQHHPLRNAVLAGIGFVLLGFAGWMYLPDSRLAMPLVAAAVVPFGIRSKSVPQGLLRGAVLGLLAGGSMFMAFARVGFGGSVVAPAPQTQPAATQASRSQPATGPAVVVLEDQTAEMHRWVRQVAPRVAVITVGGTTLLCAAVGAFFAYTSVQRRRRSQRSW